MDQNTTLLRPAKRPERVSLSGRYVCLVPLDPVTHTESLWNRSGHARSAEDLALHAGRAVRGSRCFRRSHGGQSEIGRPDVLRNRGPRNGGRGRSGHPNGGIDPAHRAGDRSRRQSSTHPRCSTRAARPKRCTFLRAIFSRIWATGVMNGNATPSTNRRGVRRFGMALLLKASFGST